MGMGNTSRYWKAGRKLLTLEIPCGSRAYSASPWSGMRKRIGSLHSALFLRTRRLIQLMWELLLRRAGWLDKQPAFCTTHVCEVIYFHGQIEAGLWLSKCSSLAASWCFHLEKPLVIRLPSDLKLRLITSLGSQLKSGSFNSVNRNSRLGYLECRKHVCTWIFHKTTKSPMGLFHYRNRGWEV